MKIAGVEVRRVERCGSTNSVLLGERDLVRPVLLVAGVQTAGRGRRGRRWHAAPGEGLTFSLALRVRRPVRELAALSLVAGVAVARALRSCGIAHAALKWPNDLVVDGAKLGGILVETRALAVTRATLAVIGIGINLRGAGALGARLRRRVTALDRFTCAGSPDDLLSAITVSLLDSIAAFEARGFAALRAEWESLDAHAGARLRLRLADGRTLSGVGAGLAEDGALRIRTREGVRAVHSARLLSARPA
jgi:BirA family biotin operon repressor/biotin-[acetyl-CoA-carboxylase] ligase